MDRPPRGAPSENHGDGSTVMVLHRRRIDAARRYAADHRLYRFRTERGALAARSSVILASSVAGVAGDARGSQVRGDGSPRQIAVPGCDREATPVSACCNVFIPFDPN